jgi:hypothetical protein
MQRLRVPAIATAIAVAACAATQARAATLATLHDASQLAAGAGLAVWSAHDAATERYQLTAQMPDGRVAPLPVDPAPAAFPVAVGATSAGALVVDARCAHEPRDITSGPPADQATGVAWRPTTRRPARSGRCGSQRPRATSSSLPPSRAIASPSAT